MSIQFELHTVLRDITVAFVTSDPVLPTRGETLSYVVELDPPPRTVIDSDTTVAASETKSFPGLIVDGATLTIDGAVEASDVEVVNGGEVAVNGTLRITTGPRDALNELGEWAGSHATLETVDNVVRFRSQLPPEAGIESLAVGVEPPDDLQDRNVVGAWGLVDAVEDQRDTTFSTNRYRLTIRVLAPYPAYQDIDDVEENLKI
jgi:hypothetical protein